MAGGNNNEVKSFDKIWQIYVENSSFSNQFWPGKSSTCSSVTWDKRVERHSAKHMDSESLLVM